MTAYDELLHFLISRLHGKVMGYSVSWVSHHGGVNVGWKKQTRKHAYLVGLGVDIPHSAKAVPLVLEEVPLVVGLLPVLGFGETALHVVSPLALAPDRSHDEHSPTRKESVAESA